MLAVVIAAAVVALTPPHVAIGSSHWERGRLRLVRRTVTTHPPRS